ncbi:MAG: folate/biopterin family MFS transporter [Oscillatoriales cyanobacterium]|nr:MAG: folate/biopterin family MFS transporter [Oscillatoriales cyanobacterium]
MATAPRSNVDPSSEPVLLPDPLAAGSSGIRSVIVEKLFFGNEPTPELIAILLVYLVQGILGLARLAVSFFLKDELHLSPAEVAALMGVVAIPWMIKPLFGFMSDGLPIFGYRRRPYLILSGIGGALAWVAMATVVHTGWAAMLAIALSSLSVAVSDVIADSLVVERARSESSGTAGSLQSLCWGVSALGGLLTAYLSGILLEQFSAQTVFWMTSMFPLLVCFGAFAIQETPLESRPDWSAVRQQVGDLWQAVSQKAIWLPTLFLFLWQSTPSSDTAFFYFTTNELQFPPEFLGRVRLVTSVAALIGVWAFQRFFKNVSFRRIFLWSTLVSTALGMTTLLLVTHTNRALGIDDRWFSLGDSLILTVAGQITFMPVLVLSARLCPPGVEATLFALLMSVYNLAGAVSSELGALLTHWLGVDETHFDRLWLLVTIANLSTLLPLPLVGWLPQGDATDATGDHDGFPPEVTAVKHREPNLVPTFMPEMSPQPERGDRSSSHPR